MYRRAYSCTLALYEPITKAVHASSQWNITQWYMHKICDTHVQRMYMSIQGMYMYIQRMYMGKPVVSTDFRGQHRAADAGLRDIPLPSYARDDEVSCVPDVIHFICQNTAFMEWIQRYCTYIVQKCTYMSYTFTYMYITCIYMVYTMFVYVWWGDQVVWALANTLPVCGSSSQYGGQSSTDPLVPGWLLDPYHSSPVQPAQEVWHPVGSCDTAAADGRRGSNVYEVNQWLWHFGCGKPRLGGLSVEKTGHRKKAAQEEGLLREAETSWCRKADWAWWKWSVVVKLYRRVCTVSLHILTSMQTYVLYLNKNIKSWICMYMLHTIYIHLSSGTYTFMILWNSLNMYIHVCSMFRRICTVLPNPVKVVRIPDLDE